LIKLKYQKAKVIDILGYKTDGGQSDTNMENCIKNVFLQSVFKGYCSERKVNSNINLTGVILPFDFSKLCQKKDDQNSEPGFNGSGLDFLIDSESDDDSSEEMQESEEDSDSDNLDSDDADVLIGHRWRIAEITNSYTRFRSHAFVSAEKSKYFQSSATTEKSDKNKLEYPLPFYTNLSHDNLKDLSVSHNYPYMLLNELEVKRHYSNYTCPVMSLAVFAHVLPLNSYDSLNFMNDMKTGDQVLESKKLPPIVKY
jgi:hypothetical protein